MGRELRAQVNQEVSAKIRDHLTQQRAQSTMWGRSAMCAYRGAGGTMCAVGCLIPDDKYDEEWETQTLDLCDTLKDMLLEEYGDYLDLAMLRCWQQYHDFGGYEDWANGMGSSASPADTHEHMMKVLGYES